MTGEQNEIRYSVGTLDTAGFVFETIRIRAIFRNDENVSGDSRYNANDRITDGAGNCAKDGIRSNAGLHADDGIRDYSVIYAKDCIRGDAGIKRGQVSSSRVSRPTSAADTTRR